MTKKAEYRGIWADCWNPGFLNPEETERMIAHCRRANINTIFLEVRKTGDAYYDSAFEPRGTNISGPDGYDPLQHVIELAHDESSGKRIEVHAWLVAYRIWKNPDGEEFSPPPDSTPAHVVNAHPEWLMLDNEGNACGDGTYYLDPGVPEVIDYNIKVTLDVAKKYDVDGINYDFFRYPGNIWGYNPISLKRFQEKYGRTDKPQPDDPEWCQWRRDMITDSIRRTQEALRKEAPDVLLTIDTTGGFGLPDGDFKKSSTYNKVFQDWPVWLEEKLLDINCRMAYKREHEPDQAQDYRDWVTFAMNNQFERMNLIGQGNYFNYWNGFKAQYEFAKSLGAPGYILFSYFATTEDKMPQDEFFARVGDEIFTEWVDTPKLPWRK